MEPRANLAFTLALSVLEPGREDVQDVLVRGNAEQSVGELARRLAVYLGHPGVDAAGQPLQYGLRVDRTGEQLRSEAGLTAVDLLEGDVVALIVPRGAQRQRPRWAEDSEAPPAPIPFPKPIR
jgi:hypothetical protein